MKALGTTKVFLSINDSTVVFSLGAFPNCDTYLIDQEVLEITSRTADTLILDGGRRIYYANEQLCFLDEKLQLYNKGDLKQYDALLNIDKEVSFKTYLKKKIAIQRNTLEHLNASHVLDSLILLKYNYVDSVRKRIIKDELKIEGFENMEYNCEKDSVLAHNIASAEFNNSLIFDELRNVKEVVGEDFYLFNEVFSSLELDTNYDLLYSKIGIGELIVFYNNILVKLIRDNMPERTIVIEY